MIVVGSAAGGQNLEIKAVGLYQSGKRKAALTIQPGSGHGVLLYRKRNLGDWQHVCAAGELPSLNGLWP
jgi:hypothetical protein